MPTIKLTPALFNLPAAATGLDVLDYMNHALSHQSRETFLTTIDRLVRNDAEWLYQATRNVATAIGIPPHALTVATNALHLDMNTSEIERWLSYDLTEGAIVGHPQIATDLAATFTHWCHRLPR